MVQDEEALFLVQAIGASCRLLLGMVSNVLSMRSIEAGELEMHPAEFSPRDALTDLLQVCRLGRAQSDIVWLNEHEPLPTSVTADRNFLNMILQNLLTNALRFHEGRGVTVSLRCAAGAPAAAATEHGATHTLEAVVTDRGRGLTAQQSIHAFEAYEASRPEEGGGSGLGLYISRACACRAGGDLCVQSTPGQGAQFTLHMPVRVPEAAAEAWAAAQTNWAAAAQQQAGPASPQPAPPLPVGKKRAAPAMTAADAQPRARALPPPAAPRLRCLLADDHALNLRLVERLLQQHGFEVITATDGREALNTLLAAYEAGTPPHIALIDMQAR